MSSLGPLTELERSGLRETAKIAVYRTLAAHLGMSVQQLKDAEERAFENAVRAYWPQGWAAAQRVAFETVERTIVGGER